MIQMTNNSLFIHLSTRSYEINHICSYCLTWQSSRTLINLFVGIFYFSIVVAVCAVFASLASDRIKKDRARWVCKVRCAFRIIFMKSYSSIYSLDLPIHQSVQPIHLSILPTHPFIESSLGRPQFGDLTCQSQQASKGLPSKDGLYEEMRDGLIWVDQTENCMMT
jgi:hypothetical protein